MTSTKDLKVVKLTPPVFQNININNSGEVVHKSGHINRTYTCLRPNHKGLPRIDAEMQDGKVIVHNYGHGGSGWTLLFGTVEKSLQKFALLAAQGLLPTDTKITIIGAGCIGLTTAVYLHEKGYTNIEIVAEKLEDTPSYNAGGLFGIVSLNIADEQLKRDCEYLIVETYRRLATIAKGKDPIFTKGVNKVFAYTGNEPTVGPIFQNMGLDLVIDYGIAPPGEEVLVDFGKNKFKMIRYETFFVYPTLMMAELHKLCKERNITITQRKVKDFSEVKSPVIFNCAGLGAKELTGDEDLHPVCGHMLELQNQPPVNETDYIIKTLWATTPVKTPEDIAKLPTLYYMPKGQGVVGGTFCKHYAGEDKEYNEKEFRAIVDRARGFFGTFTPKPAL